MTLAQLGPLFLLSPIGGMAADRFDRRTLLVVVTVEQCLVALIIAWLTDAHDPRIGALFAAVLASGIGQAFYAPTFSALIPTLVERKDLPGAISLNSANMNLSRVIGPAIGGVLYAKVGAPWAFVVNAASYLALIGALATVRLPAHHRAVEQGWRRILDGFDVARRDRVVGPLPDHHGALLVLLPPDRRVHAGPRPQRPPDRRQHHRLRPALRHASAPEPSSVPSRSAPSSPGSGSSGSSASASVAMRSTLAVFGLLRSPGPAYPVVFLLGLFYFVTVTSLATVLQKRLDDSVRGRVMALWVMAFGGTVPLGAIVAGPLSERFSISAVVLAGAVVAAGLVFYANLRRPLTGSGPGAPWYAMADEFSVCSVRAPHRTAGHGHQPPTSWHRSPGSGRSNRAARRPTPRWPRPRSWP